MESDLLNTSSTIAPGFVSLEGECEWSPLNSFLTSLLFFMLLLNLLATFIIFQIPLISSRGRSNPVNLCIRFLNVIDIVQVSKLKKVQIFTIPAATRKSEWRSPYPRFRAWATQLWWNVTAVASRWRRCARFDRPGNRSQDLPQRSLLPLHQTSTSVKTKSLCIYFVCSQALLLLIMPAFSDQDCHWIGGEVSCKAWGFAALSLLLVSPLITIMMALDRVIALYRPFKYKSNFGLQVSRLVVCSSILVWSNENQSRDS